MCFFIKNNWIDFFSVIVSFVCEYTPVGCLMNVNNIKRLCQKYDIIIDFPRRAGQVHRIVLFAYLVVWFKFIALVIAIIWSFADKEPLR